MRYADRGLLPTELHMFTVSTKYFGRCLLINTRSYLRRSLYALCTLMSSSSISVSASPPQVGFSSHRCLNACNVECSLSSGTTLDMQCRFRWTMSTCRLMAPSCEVNIDLSVYVSTFSLLRELDIRRCQSPQFFAWCVQSAQIELPPRAWVGTFLFSLSSFVMR